MRPSSGGIGFIPTPRLPDQRRSRSSMASNGVNRSMRPRRMSAAITRVGLGKRLDQGLQTGCLRRPANIPIPLSAASPSRWATRWLERFAPAGRRSRRRLRPRRPRLDQTSEGRIRLRKQDTPALAPALTRPERSVSPAGADAVSCVLGSPPLRFRDLCGLVRCGSDERTVPKWGGANAYFPRNQQQCNSSRTGLISTHTRATCRRYR